MSRNWKIAAAAVLALGAGSAGAATPANITQALANTARPAADSSRDVARKPGELLAFGGVKPGDKVVDLVMGAAISLAFCPVLSVPRARSLPISRQSSSNSAQPMPTSRKPLWRSPAT